MHRSLGIVIAAPLLACATAAGGGPKYPAGVEVRASCAASPPESGFVDSEQELMQWLDGGALEREPRGPEGMYGGEACTRGMLGEVDWSTQRIAFMRGSAGGTVEKMSIRGSTLVVFQEVQRQCGGIEMPMFVPGTSVVVVPARVEAVEWKNHSELCDWQKKGLPPPP